MGIGDFLQDKIDNIPGNPIPKINAAIVSGTPTPPPVAAAPTPPPPSPAPKSEGILTTLWNKIPVMDLGDDVKKEKLP